MAVDHLPAQVREFANYLEGLLARLDQGSGWCAVFWQRDPDGMRACLDGQEVPPWDVVEALLQDLAAEYGTPVAAQDAERARPLHAAALAAHDARPGGRDALGDRLDVMLREQRYAVERQAELGRLLAAAATQEEADALRLDLAWAHDDHERATARCAELSNRIAELDRRSGGGQVQGSPLIRPRAGGSGSGRGTAGSAQGGEWGGAAGSVQRGERDGAVDSARRGGAASARDAATPAYGDPRNAATSAYDAGDSAAAAHHDPRSSADSGYDGAPAPADSVYWPSTSADSLSDHAYPAHGSPAAAEPGYDQASAAGYDRGAGPAGGGYDKASGTAVAGDRRAAASADFAHSAPAAAEPGYDRDFSANEYGRAADRSGTGYAARRGYAPEGDYGPQWSSTEPTTPAGNAPVARAAGPGTASAPGGTPDSGPHAGRYPGPASAPGGTPDPGPTPGRYPDPSLNPASAPSPTPSEGTPLPKQRKRRRGSARFAGVGEAEGAAPVVVPPAAVPVAPAPVTASRRTLRGARFAGAAAEAQPESRAEASADGAAGPEAAGRETAEAVDRLVRLRGEGRSGEAHALLVELAYWPAARIPLLAAGLQRAGLNADWATLLWEAASLPADRLVDVADALAEAGRAADGEQVLRQGVVRPAEEIGKAAGALVTQGRRREVRALLDAFVRVRTPEDAARGAEPEPHVLVPLLLEAARGVSKDRHRDLVHALRAAGYPT